jgi:hypothetical protein
MASLLPKHRTSLSSLDSFGKLLARAFGQVSVSLLAFLNHYACARALALMKV